MVHTLSGLGGSALWQMRKRCVDRQVRSRENAMCLFRKHVFGDRFVGRKMELGSCHRACAAHPSGARLPPGETESLRHQAWAVSHSLKIGPIVLGQRTLGNERTKGKDGREERREGGREYEIVLTRKISSRREKQDRRTNAPTKGGSALPRPGVAEPGRAQIQAIALPTNTTAFFPMGGPKRPLRRRSSLDMMMSCVCPADVLAEKLMQLGR